MAEGLKDGKILCKYRLVICFLNSRVMNALRPGSIAKINENKMPFKQVFGDVEFS